MFVYMLMGDNAGQFLHVADTDATKGISDGWCADLSDKPYPYENLPLTDLTSDLPASYTAWVDAGSPYKDDGDEPQPPIVATITAIDPAAVDIGSTAEITVTGTDFLDSAKVYVSATAVTTTFVSATEIKGKLTGALTAEAGDKPVAVRNETGGTDSNLVALTVNEPAEPVE